LIACYFAGALGSGLDLSDGESLIQQSVGRTQLIDDIYLTTAETLDDLMFWAVLHKSMKKTRPSHSHILLVRKGSEIIKRAHAIRMAIGGAFWNSRVEVFNPSVLNLQSVDASNFRRLAAFQYPADRCKRVVSLDPDMLVLQNIDDMTHRFHSLTLARDQGDCRNLTDAFSTERKAMHLVSMVPETDTGAVTLLTSGATQLNAEVASGLPLTPVNNASLLSLAYKKAHPERKQAMFATEEVMSAACLVKHKDSALMSRADMSNMKVLYLGEEGKKLIREIIAHSVHGNKRLQNTVAALETAGRSTLAQSIKTWFEFYESDDVKAIMDAGKNGPLAES